MARGLSSWDCIELMSLYTLSVRRNQKNHLARREYVGRNVEKVEYLLRDIRQQMSDSEYESVRMQAEDQDLIVLDH